MRKMLAACEESGIVRDAFAARGWDAWSCDLLPSARPGQHLQHDVRCCFEGSAAGYTPHWDLMIAFPPCTHLASSGARWFKNKKHDQDEAIAFVHMLLEAPVQRIAIENPVGILSTRIRKPDQIIQPWQFWDGEPDKGEVKATCLWLKGLPKLVPTTPNEAGRIARIWRMGPSPTRSRDRSRTYQGIANAMAEQWSGPR